MSASVKIMLSYDYCHFEVSISSDANTVVAANELRKAAQRLADDGRLQAQAVAAGVEEDVRLLGHCSTAELDALYADAYAATPFVHVVAQPPATKHVLGSNTCRVHVRLDERTGRVLAIGVIDNLVKGTAGAAIQSINIALGIPEQTGLTEIGLH